MKKVISLGISILLIFSFIFCNSKTVFASEKTSKEGVAWAFSQVGSSVDFDGYYGAQCVDLIMAYYDFLGGEISGGNAVDYVFNKLPVGWTRIKGGVPQKGDILIYAGGSDLYYGHLGIFESSTVSYHQGKGIVYKTDKSYLEITSSRGAPYWGCIHPDFLDTKVNLCQNGHTVVIDNEILPNCMMDGKSEGSHCSVCNAVIKPQEVIPAKGHNFGNNLKYCCVCLELNPNYVESVTMSSTTIPEDKKAISSFVTPVSKAAKIKSKTNKTIKSTSIKNLKKGTRSLSFALKKVNGVSGYQIQYSTDKGFSKAVKSVSFKKTVKVIKRLRSNKIYYIRVRTYKYKKENNVRIKIYSKWSRTKSIKIK